MRERRDTPATVRELVAWLASGIHNGTWPPETRLPPERTLAEQLRVNRSTVAAAYMELQARGLVDRRQGSGTYVHGDLWGIVPDWTRYLERAAFRPMQPLVQRVQEARQRPETVDFSQADLGPALWPRGALSGFLQGMEIGESLGYAHALGMPALREAIAAEMRRRSALTVEPDALLVTTGAQQALYLVARGLLRPGDAIALERPSFYYSQALFQSAGIRLLPIPMDRDGVLPDRLEGVIREHRPAMVWLNPTYHNPTTTTLSLERRHAVLEISRRWNLPIVEDDAFSYLTVDGQKEPPPPLRSLGDGHQVIYIGTLSKIVAPGLRVGWIAAPRPIVERLADVKGQIDLGMPGIAQALAASFLADPAWNDHLRDVRQSLRARRDAFCAALAPLASRGATWSTPDGGLYVWLRFADDTPDRVRLERAISAGVVYGPGRIYGAEDGWARLNYLVQPAERVEGALSRLAAL